MYNGLGGRSRPLLAVRRTEAPKAVEIEAVSRGCFKSSWSLMRLERRRHRPLTSRGFANNSKAFQKLQQKSFLACHFMMVIPSVLSCLWCEVDDGINNLTLFFAFIVSKNPIMLSQNPESKILNKTRMKRLSMKARAMIDFLTRNYFLSINQTIRHKKI